MAEFMRFSSPSARVKVAFTSSTGIRYVDYKQCDDLRRMMTPNGKVQGRKRTGLDAHDQRLASRAIKRARFMALLPYTSATL